MQYVQRINGKAPGWQVRLGPRNSPLTEFYADGKHGGAESARAKADAALAKLAKKYPELAVPERSVRMQSNNRSGIPGLRPLWRQYGGYFYLYVQVSWSDPDGRPRCRALSANRHGVLPAIEHAIKLRSQHTPAKIDMTPRQVYDLWRERYGDEIPRV